MASSVNRLLTCVCVLIALYLGSISATLNVGPFCSSSCPELTYGPTDYLCIGVENNEVFCYGSTAACMYGTSQCLTDADCVAYQNSPKRSAGMCDNRASAGGTDWPWSGCNTARLRNTAPPTQLPTTLNPTAAPTVGPTVIPTAAPTVDPSADPTADPTTDPTVVPSTIPTATPTTDPTSAPSENQYLTQIRSSPSYGSARNGFAFAAYTPSGAMQAWGEGSSMIITTVASTGVESVSANRASFVALLSDGTVEAYGTAAYMAGYETYQSGTALVSLVANDGAYAGVDATGAAIAFGGPGNGNSIAASGFATQLASGVKAIVASAGSFTALMLDGTVFTWGSKYCGGGVSSLTRTDLVGIVKVVATKTAFAGLTVAGGIVTWGESGSGGDCSAVAAQLQSDVIHVVSTQTAFVAFKRDNSLVVWGNPWYGADTSEVAAELTADIVYVAHTSAAFAALKADGSVVVWGKNHAGGETSAVQSELHDVTTILGNHHAFAALKTDGSVVAWGDAAEGGSIPSDLTTSLSAGVTELFATRRAFAALKGATGELVPWGNPYHGGDAGAAAVYLTSGVRTVCSNDAAFTAILQDGRAAAWGHASAVSAPGLLRDSTGAVYTAFTANSKCV